MLFRCDPGISLAPSCTGHYVDVMSEHAQAPETAEKQPERPRAYREYRKHVRLSPRSIVPRPLVWTSLAARALESLVPWSRYDYPGKGKAHRELFADRVGSGAIKAWRTERNPLPAWAALILAGLHRARAEVSTRLAAELEAYAAAKEAAPSWRGGNLKRRGEVRPGEPKPRSEREV